MPRSRGKPIEKMTSGSTPVNGQERGEQAPGLLAAPAGGPPPGGGGTPVPLVSLKAISKTYPGSRALTAVDLDLFAGEVHAIAGENGAGKSTLLKVIAGIEAP